MRILANTPPDQIAGKVIAVRLDGNVPFAPNTSAEGLHDAYRVTDDFRLQAAAPTFQFILKHGGYPVGITHFGKPSGPGEATKKTTIRPIALRMREILGGRLNVASDWTKADLDRMCKGLKDRGGIGFTENVRLLDGETGNTDAAGEFLANSFDGCVVDGFGVLHREHASVHAAVLQAHTLGKLSVAGHLVVKEIDAMKDVAENPAKPLVVIFGGLKVSDKIHVIERFAPLAAKVIIVGAMASAFLKADGKQIGKSFCTEADVEKAQGLLERFREKILLPTDCVGAEVASKNDLNAGTGTYACDVADVKSEFNIFDIGEDTRAAIAAALPTGGGTIICNGPAGLFEDERFRAGTKSVVEAIAEAHDRGTTTIIGGGESAQAVRDFGLAARNTHVSTGGGAAQDFLGGKTLPGLKALGYGA